ncbi:MAG: 7-cyano-7-deazaguanine synthase QueC [Thermoplasmata archaeon]|nr:7-cyano-7-deazaguanine synthase QueC [Thermoplasmata archaeon]
MKAVLLLSGGLDSATVLGIAKSEGYEIHALSFVYGQRHGKELASAEKLCKYFGVKNHVIIKINLDEIGGSALTDRTIDVPGANAESGRAIPVTYVPARNLIFLSIAGAYAEVIGASTIFIGANQVDFSGYPDCREEFLKSFEETLAKGTKAGVSGKRIRVVAPLLLMTKGEIIKEGMRLGVPYELTWTCYKGGELACGQCEACILRLKGFRDAGYEDPLKYETGQKM